MPCRVGPVPVAAEHVGTMLEGLQPGGQGPRLFPPALDTVGWRRDAPRSHGPPASPAQDAPLPEAPHPGAAHSGARGTRPAPCLPRASLEDPRAPGSGRPTAQSPSAHPAPRLAASAQVRVCGRVCYGSPTSFGPSASSSPWPVPSPPTVCVCPHLDRGGHQCPGENVTPTSLRSRLSAACSLAWWPGGWEALAHQPWASARGWLNCDRSRPFGTASPRAGGVRG